MTDLVLHFGAAIETTKPETTAFYSPLNAAECISTAADLWDSFSSIVFSLDRREDDASLLIIGSSLMQCHRIHYIAPSFS